MFANTSWFAGVVLKQYVLQHYFLLQRLCTVDKNITTIGVLTMQLSDLQEGNCLHEIQLLQWSVLTSFTFCLVTKAFNLLQEKTLESSPLCVQALCRRPTSFQKNKVEPKTFSHSLLCFSFLRFWKVYKEPSTNCWMHFSSSCCEFGQQQSLCCWLTSLFASVQFSGHLFPGKRRKVGKQMSKP